MTPAGGGDAPVRAAVIDIGSNSVLLLTVALEPDGWARALDAKLATTRLGRGLADGGTLNPAARGETLVAVTTFAARARAAGATRVWAFATAAARRASDGAAFAREVAASAGVPVEILSDEEEARLAYAAVAHALGDGGPLVAIEIGGGTTELAFGFAETMHGSVTLPLGALRLTEEYLRSDPPTVREFGAATAAVAAALQASGIGLRERAAGALLAASGGTATALAALDLGLAAYDPARVHGHWLRRETFAALVTRLFRVPRAERARWSGLDPGRAAVLPGGALVLQRVLLAAGRDAVQVSDHGVRHAYLRRRLAEVGVAADLRALWP